MHTGGMLKNNIHVYQRDLLALDACTPKGDWTRLILSSDVFTPLVAEAWTRELSNYPDRTYTRYVLQGIQNGFRIGFNRSHSIRPATRNLHIENPEVVSDYLHREVSLNRMWKVPAAVLPKGVHISPLGIIPKKNKPNKWRLIVDMSSPTGASINDGINSEHASLSYTSIDHLSALVASEGKNVFLVKVDIN